MKVAIVHYWFTGMRGGEKVVETLCGMFPEADLFAHVAAPDTMSDALRRHRIETTFIQRLPGASRWYRRYLALMPLALEQLDLREYDLVISSESGPTKGVLAPPSAAHVCYCHTPMRYLWDMYHPYLEKAGLLTRTVMRPVMHYLRQWDVSSASRVDRFVANSEHVRRRIRRYYGRSADVVHPPVDVEAFELREEREDFYLVVGQLVAYKRVDLAVGALTRLGRPLVVIGHGERERELRRRAGPGVRFLGWQPDEIVRDHYARCRAVVFPGLED
ncbi:MAG: glycosyltransferase, partial [Gemmatimonadota bacterium]